MISSSVFKECHVFISPMNGVRGLRFSICCTALQVREFWSFILILSVKLGLPVFLSPHPVSLCSLFSYCCCLWALTFRFVFFFCFSSFVLCFSSLVLVSRCLSSQFCVHTSFKQWVRPETQSHFWNWRFSLHSWCDSGQNRPHAVHC